MRLIKDMRLYGTQPCPQMFGHVMDVRGGQVGAKEPIVAPPGFHVALGQLISYTKLDLSLPSGIQISDTRLISVRILASYF